MDELEEIELWDELENASFFLELPFKAGDIVKVETLCNPTYYGVFTGRWKKNPYPKFIEMTCSLDVYIPDRDLFDYTDDILADIREKLSINFDQKFRKLHDIKKILANTKK